MRPFLPVQHSKLLSALPTGVLTFIPTPSARFLFLLVAWIGRYTATLAPSHPGSTRTPTPDIVPGNPIFVESIAATGHPHSFARNYHPDRRESPILPPPPSNISTTMFRRTIAMYTHTNPLD